MSVQNLTQLNPVSDKEIPLQERPSLPISYGRFLGIYGTPMNRDSKAMMPPKGKSTIVLPIPCFRRSQALPMQFVKVDTLLKR